MVNEPCPLPDLNALTIVPTESAEESMRLTDPAAPLPPISIPVPQFVKERS